MNHYFDEIKQHYPKTAKALGITADMTLDEWREGYDRMIIQKFMRPWPADISGLNEPTPRPWYSFYPPQLQPITPKE